MKKLNIIIGIIMVAFVIVTLNTVVKSEGATAGEKAAASVAIALFCGGLYYSCLRLSRGL